MKIIENNGKEGSMNRKQELERQRRKAGICVQCGFREALPGIQRCEFCRDLSRKRAVEHYYRNREAICEAEKENRRAWKAAGICTRCGKQPAEAGYLRCNACREEAKARRREWYRARKSEKEGEA